MTAIEFEEYLIMHGVPDKEARATAYGMEKFVSASKPVSEEYLNLTLKASLSQMKHELYIAGFVALAPLYAKIFGVI